MTRYLPRMRSFQGISRKKLLTRTDCRILLSIWGEKTEDKQLKRWCLDVARNEMKIIYLSYFRKATENLDIEERSRSVGGKRLWLHTSGAHTKPPFSCYRLLSHSAPHPSPSPGPPRFVWPELFLDFRVQTESCTGHFSNIPFVGLLDFLVICLWRHASIKWDTAEQYGDVSLRVAIFVVKGKAWMDRRPGLGRSEKDVLDLVVVRPFLPAAVALIKWSGHDLSIERSRLSEVGKHAIRADLEFLRRASQTFARAFNNQKRKISTARRTCTRLCPKLEMFSPPVFQLCSWHAAVSPTNQWGLCALRHGT